MDTIVFFYQKRGLCEPEVEPVGLKKYLLIRVGLDAAREEWFGRRLEPPEGSAGEEGDRDIFGGKCPVTGQGGGGGNPGTARRWNRGLFLGAWREKRRRTLVRREAEDRLAARARMLAEIGEAMERLAFGLAELAGDWRDCSYVYEDSLRRALIGAGSGAEGLQAEGLPALWKRYFSDREFTGYHQRFWVDQLLSWASAPHFILLGTARCLFPLLEENARRMKSLRWILPEGSLDGALEGFVEDFYIEYGLAIGLQALEDPGAWKRQCLSCGEPVNVLDFTGEAYLAVPALPEGSVWLDMGSLEEKRRRILARGRGTAYFSLKEMWKSAQKRCVCPRLP